MYTPFIRASFYIYSYFSLFNFFIPKPTPWSSWLYLVTYTPSQVCLPLLLSVSALVLPSVYMLPAIWMYCVCVASPISLPLSYTPSHTALDFHTILRTAVIHTLDKMCGRCLVRMAPDKMCFHFTTAYTDGEVGYVELNVVCLCMAFIRLYLLLPFYLSFSLPK